MNTFKKIFAPILVGSAFLVGASSAGATTVKVNCGEVADGASVVCEDEWANDSFNLAIEGTNYLFEASIDDTAIEAEGPTNLLDGALTIHTFVDPYWSTASTTANIVLFFDEPIGSATVSFGGLPVNLVDNGSGSLVSGYLQAIFPESGMLDIVLAWQGMSGGNGISITVSAVPLPAGALLLLSALGGLGLARRRRSAERAFA